MSTTLLNFIELKYLIQNLNKDNINDDMLQHIRNYIKEEETKPNATTWYRKREDRDIIACGLMIGYQLSEENFIIVYNMIKQLGNDCRFNWIIPWHCDYYDDHGRLLELKLKGLVV